MKRINAYFLSILFTYNVLFIGCLEKRAEHPKEVYLLWSGQEPTKEVSLIHGKYWQSAHFSKEYIMYLELKASPHWRKEFIRQNGLIPDTSAVGLPSDAPMWFKPGKNFRIWTQHEFSQGSKYFEDPISGHMFIYEIQL